ncbi:uncharacterized protein LOC126978568 [Leptidea sinapis]|uniref:uncharacterized protein LOC126978568 n=1 Tax=Leptidea sinapis TaxID=189913 RepID=UPI0021C48EC9|nr:uncharacterized protein LOC126978568 [Leptidea sinapis]
MFTRSKSSVKFTELKHAIHDKRANYSQSNPHIIKTSRRCAVAVFSRKPTAKGHCISDSDILPQCDNVAGGSRTDATFITIMYIFDGRPVKWSETSWMSIVVGVLMRQQLKQSLTNTRYHY